MDVEISVAGGLIERHKWGKNIKIYTRRFRKDKLENVTFDWPVGTEGKNDDDGNKNYREGNSDEMDIDMVSDRSIYILAAQVSSVQNKDNDIVVDQSLLRIEAVKELNPVQEKDKDILLDQALQIVASDNQSLQSTATEDLISVLEDGNDTMLDQSLQITATEDLNLVQWYENDTMHDQSFQITTTEELNSAQKDENDTMHDQNLTSVQEDDIDTVYGQSLRISAEKKLNLVQEDRDDIVNNQSLEVIANKDLKSVEKDRNGLVHDQSLQVIANKDLKPVEEDRNDTVHDQSLELMAIKDLKSVRDDRNDTVHDRSLEVIGNEDLNSVEEDRNDTVHHLSLEAMAIEDLESGEEDRTDTTEDQSLEAIANEDLKSVEDVINDTVHHQSLEVIANKDLKSVEEDGNDAELDQYLENIAKEDLKSIDRGIKDTTHDQSLETIGIEDLKSVQKEDSDSVHEYSVPLDTEDLNSLQEAGNDSGNDQFLQTVALEDPNAVQDDKDGTTHDQPSEIIASEDLGSVQKDFNDTLHDLSLQMTATEDLSLAQDDKDDAAHDHSLQAVNLKDLASVRKEDNDKLHESSVSITTDDMNSAQEDDNNTMHEESLQTIANEDLNSVQEDKSDTLHHQSLQIITNKDLNSRQKEDNDTVHESSVTVATEDIDLMQEDINDTVHDQPLKVVTEDLNLLQGRESVSLLHLGNDDLVSDHDPPLQGTVENGCALRNDYALDKPMIIKADGKVTISLAPARSKNKIRGLKRNLEYEVDQVRSVVKRLDAKKIQLTSSSAGNGIYGVNRSHMHTQVEEVRGLAKVNSVVGSVDYYDSRPFQHLNVHKLNNYHDVYEFSKKEKRNPKQNQYYRSSEFLLAKDRLPLADSNKKLKCNGLRKHGGETGYGFVRNKYTAKAFKSCTNLLARLTRHKFGWVFNKPVDAEALGIHDYHYIIRNPMDLGTIKSRLAKNLYKFPAEFAEDVRLTLRNAMTYNPRGHEVHIMAEKISNIFEDKWVAIESDYNYNWRYGLGHDMALPTPSLRKVLPPASLARPPALDTRVLEKAESMTMPTDCRLEPNTPVGRTPVPKKPKAKDPHKRDMTYDEKQRLSIHLQNLPSDKMDAIIQIINRSNSSLSQRDDEIELDIDTLNAETLWDLDRLVTNYKKNLSKKKRRAELALQAKAEARPAVLPTDHTPAITQAPEASKKDQNNARAFPRPGEKPRDVRSFLLPGEKLRESSSSSSSSSDSDSDSSDSDSDSSSGNG